MDKTIYNENNLTMNDIDTKTIRVKVFLINKNNEILIANCAGSYMLPGGHFEEGETLTSCVIREVQEETGIVLNLNEIPNPFYEVNHFTKNHRNSGKNNFSQILYYVIKTNKEPDLSNINLTEHEKENNFYIAKIPYNNFENEMNKIIDGNYQEVFKIIATETLTAFKYLDKNLKNNLNQI